MTKIMKMKAPIWKSEVFVVCVLYFFGLALRLYNLHLIPPAISHVELDYVINAKSVWQSGKDLSQTWSPLSFTALHSRETLAEIPQVLLAPFIGPLPFSLVNARLPFAFIYGFFPVILYLLARHLFDKRTAVIAGLLAAIEPWFLYFSRTSYESPLSPLFYLTGLYIILRSKDWKMLLSLPFLFLGFFSYHGAKAVFVPFVLAALIYHFIHSRNMALIKYYAVIGLSSLLLMLGFVVSLKYQPAGARNGQIIFFNQDFLSNIVNHERTFAVPTKTTALFSNKLTVIVKEFFTTYLGAYSPQTLFVIGEYLVGGLTLRQHGYFYLIDFFILLVGLIAAYLKSKKVFFLLATFLLIAPLNSAINVTDRSYVCRANLMFPVILIFIAVGLNFLLSQARNKAMASAGLVVVYFFFFSNFMYISFHRNPIYNAEGMFFSKRILSTYLKQAVQQSRPVYVYVDEPEAAFEQYIFYANRLNDETRPAIAHAKVSRDYQLDGIHFLNNCPSEDVVSDPNTIMIIEAIKKCPFYGKEASLSGQRKIVDLKDNGSLFLIYNDMLCRNVKPVSYITLDSIHDFALKESDSNELCSSWLVN